jgi:hypothetical protein
MGQAEVVQRVGACAAVIVADQLDARGIVMARRAVEAHRPAAAGAAVAVAGADRGHSRQHLPPPEARRVEVPHQRKA